MNHSETSDVRDEVCSLPRRLIAWPVSSNWSLGLLLAAAFWMPHVRGCDGRIVVPSENAAMLIEDGEANKVIIYFWPYAFGLLTALSIFTVAAFRFQKTDQLLLSAQVLAWCFLWVVIAIEAQPKATEDNADLIPPLLLPTLWCFLSVRKRDWITAWARLTTAMAVLSIPWLFLTNLFGKETYYGMVCAYAGILGLAIAPWSFRWNWERVLISPHCVTRPIRFRLSNLLFVMALGAALYAYYRYLTPLIGK